MSTLGNGQVVNTYTFTLTVTDSNGQTATSPQTVIVYSPADQSPFDWVVLPNAPDPNFGSS